MYTTLYLLGAVASAVVLGWFVWQGLTSTVLSERKGRDRTQRRLYTEEQENMDRARDVFLFVVGTVVSVMGVSWFSEQFLLEVSNGSIEALSQLDDFLGSIGGGEMDILTDDVVRWLIGAALFFISFGMSVWFIPEIFPGPRDARGTRLMSNLTALTLSLAFSLYAVNSSDLFLTFMQEVVVGFSRVVVSFLSVLFGTMGLYLAWKKLSVNLSQIRRSTKQR